MDNLDNLEQPFFLADYIYIYISPLESSAFSDFQ
jgi:hypothetical protein